MKDTDSTFYCQNDNWKKETLPSVKQWYQEAMDVVQTSCLTDVIKHDKAGTDNTDFQSTWYPILSYVTNKKDFPEFVYSV